MHIGILRTLHLVICPLLKTYILAPQDLVLCVGAVLGGQGSGVRKVGWATTEQIYYKEFKV